jgi:eukaryotic-like serine/threonine-protein kinase
MKSVTDPNASPPEPTERSAETPTVLGAYRLLSLIGEGGMGRVYLARHTRTGMASAVKILRPELAANRSAVRRFIAEARTVCRIGHVNIVRVLDFIEPESGAGQVGYSMEILSGTDLRGELARGPMPLQRALGIALQVCEALSAVHEASVIHRDLKPANIFLARGEHREDLVKILDFGVAKLESPEDGLLTTPSTTGRPLGTPAYMSPEQAGGERVDRRSDLYSLGVILYEMVTGRRPFEAANFAGYVLHHTITAPIRPSELGPPGALIPDELDRVILRCLEKDPEHRYQNANALAGDIRRLIPRRSMVMGIPRGLFRPSSRPAASRVIALSAVGAFIAFGVFAIMGSAPPPYKTPAAAEPFRAPSPQPSVSNAASLPTEAAKRSTEALLRAIQVTSEPPGARVFFGRSSTLELGRTPCRVILDPKVISDPVLVLRLDGYRTVESPLPEGHPGSLLIPLTPERTPGASPASSPKIIKGSSKPRRRGGPSGESPADLDHMTLDPYRSAP